MLIQNVLKYLEDDFVVTENDALAAWIRRHHPAGVLGTAFYQELLKRKWLVRSETKRVMRLTLEGRRNFDRLFGIRL